MLVIKVRLKKVQSFLVYLDPYIEYGSGSRRRFESGFLTYIGNFRFFLLVHRELINEEGKMRLSSHVSDISIPYPALQRSAMFFSSS